MKLSSKMNTELLLKIDGAARSVAAAFSFTVEKTTGLKTKYLMWVLLMMGFLVTLVFAPGLAVLAIVAIGLMSTMVDFVLGHESVGAGLRVGVTALLVGLTLAFGIVGIWPLYLVVLALWVGSANWTPPPPPEPPAETPAE